MTLPVVTIDTLLNHPEGVCAQYTRENLEMLLPAEFTAVEILTRDSHFPDGSSPTVQDRLYSIMRADVITPEGLAAADQWVQDRFAEIPATTTEGSNCKNNWPAPNEFRRAVMLSDLMRYESGDDALFVSEFLSVLEGI